MRYARPLTRRGSLNRPPEGGGAKRGDAGAATSPSFPRHDPCVASAQVIDSEFEATMTKPRSPVYTRRWYILRRTDWPTLYDLSTPA
jgi:hypothetical protein